MNGRQIRNAVNTARQLARYQRVKMSYTHVEQAVDVVNESEKYVTDVHGHDDEENARYQGLRNDRFCGCGQIVIFDHIFCSFFSSPFFSVIRRLTQSCLANLK